MPLSFSRTPEGHFRVTETTFSFRGTSIKTVDYSADLAAKRVNDEPWRDTVEADRSWFHRYYTPKFEAL